MSAPNDMGVVALFHALDEQPDRDEKPELREPPRLCGASMEQVADHHDYLREPERVRRGL